MDAETPAPAGEHIEQTDEVATGGAPLPAGTVTFLLTDVEGSTRLWAERPDDMAAVVPRHYDLLDAEIVRHGGLRPVEQGEGDSVVAVFARATDAVEAAAAAQCRLREELPWLSVRMAVHTGAAQLRDEGNYAGPTIIRCARLRACAHGGQVLVSETTAPLVADQLTGGLALLDLGRVRLRDLARAEHVWQLVHPALRRDFPVLRSLDQAPHNLPVPLTSFVGRETEQDVARHLLRQHRLVTITGSGGAGKTRLAVEVAASSIEEHPGGTWWVELASATGAAEVGERLVMALGLVPVAGLDPVEQVVRLCQAGAPVLLALDNAEHLLDAVADVSTRILAACPPVRILVTSRESLGVPGEVVWRIPSLAVPPAGAVDGPEALQHYDATRLFVDRARSVRPNLAIDARGAALVGQICMRLDGIPLAVELAAARTRSMTLERIAAGLNDAFRLLTGGARTMLARQQTLLASIAWSVDALGDRERAVYRRLAVFVAPFTLDAAEAVAADGVLVEALDVIDLVERLVDKSLVQFDDGAGRYSLLETLRQFGLDRLRDSGELAVTRARHAEWFATWSEAVGRGAHGLDARPMRADLPDAFAALEWSFESDPRTVARLCVGLANLRHRAAAYTAVDAQCDWVLSFDRSIDPQAWARAAAGTATPAWLVRRFDVLGVLDDARALLAPHDDYARLLLDSPQAIIEALGGDDGRLARLADAARALGDDGAFIAIAGSLAWLRVHTGDFPAARVAIDSVRGVLTAHRLPFTFDHADMCFLADFELDLLTGELTRALRFVEQLRRAFGSAAHPLAADASILALARDDVALLADAEAMIEPGAPGAYAHLSGFVRCVAALARGDVDVSADVGTAAWADARGHGVLRGLLCVPLTVAMLAAGRVADAEQHVAEWREDVRALGDKPLQLATQLHCAALVHRAVGRSAESGADAYDLLALSDRCGFALARIDALELVGEHALDRGHETLAARLLGAAASERERIGYVRLVRPDATAVRARMAALAARESGAFDEGRNVSMDAAVELARRGRGERGRTSYGWASLTPTERQVVQLVAGGLSNADIARRLLMSLPTVKSHLTHVFAKLGLANRTELAAEALRRSDPAG